MNPPRKTLLLAVLATLVCVIPAAAQVPRVAPSPGFVLVTERAVAGVTVQQWVRGSSPEVSPAGMCECMTVVYQGTTPVLTLGQPDLVSAITINEVSGRDINGDGVADLVVDEWSGGAHCCYETTIYSLEQRPRPLLSLQAGNCGPGELLDLDGDGRLEVVTCDDRWAATYCPFAFSPMPRVVFAYDVVTREYVPDTPRFARRSGDQLAAAVSEAERAVRDIDIREPGREKCAVLGPALTSMYEGRVDDGVAIIRRVYTRADRDELEREVVAQVMSSPLWRR